MSSLAGARIAIVGASSGVGRAVALRVLQAGADVVLVGRDAARLEVVRKEAGAGTTVTADLTRDEDVARLTKVLAERPVDVLLTTAGAAPLVFLADATRAQWEQVLTTNVVGTASLLQAAAPHLAPTATVVVISSESVGQGRPGLGPYAASKAALDDLLHTWRNEKPTVRFTTVALGGTMPTAFADAFDPEATLAAVTDWAARGRMQEQNMHTDEVADVLTAIVSAMHAAPGVGVERIELRSPSPISGTTAHLREQAPNRIDL